MTPISDDKALVSRLKAGDQSAVADLETRYGARILQLALRYTKNREDAEEVAQDVLLKVYTRIADFRGESALSSWIYRITFNTAMSRLRSLKASRTAEVDRRVATSASPDSADRPGVPLDVADWSSLADDQLMRAQLRRRVAAALGQIPTIYRVPVVLRDIQGLTTEEASAVLRVKDQTLKSRLHRGRLILRESLTEFADGLSLHRPTALPRVRTAAGLASAA